MPSVPIIRTAWGQTRPDTMGVKVENEAVVSLITTPVTVDGSPGTWRVDRQDRPGRQAITQASAPGLRGLTFSHTVSSPNPNVSIEHLLHPFRGIAEKGKRVQFIGGGWLVTGTWWWIENLDFKETMKARDNRTSRMTLTWTCVEANRVSAVALTKTGVKAGTVRRAGTVTRVPAGGR